MQCAGKNYDCEEYRNDDGWNEPSGHAGYSCEVLGSSYSGDAPLGMHAGQQQHRNKHNCCRREDKKVCDHDSLLQRLSSAAGVDGVLKPPMRAHMPLWLLKYAFSIQWSV